MTNISNQWKSIEKHFLALIFFLTLALLLPRRRYNFLSSSVVAPQHLPSAGDGWWWELIVCTKLHILYVQEVHWRHSGQLGGVICFTVLRNTYRLTFRLENVVRVVNLYCSGCPVSRCTQSNERVSMSRYMDHSERVSMNSYVKWKPQSVLALRVSPVEAWI